MKRHFVEVRPSLDGCSLANLDQTATRQSRECAAHVTWWPSAAFLPGEPKMKDVIKKLFARSRDRQPSARSTGKEGGIE